MSDKKNVKAADDKVEEAGFNPSHTKSVKASMQNDAWKDASKWKPGTEPRKVIKRDPSDFDSIDFTDKSPSGLKLANETGTAGVAGFQAPMAQELTDEQLAIVRELVKNKVKEVVRKKPGGGGYTLYAPNRGKKDKPRAVGTFPTKLGAKRAELSRFPPKDPGKLKRLRKEVEKLQKDPKKFVDASSKKKDSEKKKVSEAATPFSSSTNPTQPTVHKDLNSFMTGLKALPKDSPQRGKYVTSHMSDPGFLDALKKHPQGAQIHKQLTDFLNSKANAGMSTAKVTVAGQPSTSKESVDRKKQFYERAILSKIITRSLTESLFREEKEESEWDSYISKLSKQALTGDSKFQKLQKNILGKTDAMLNNAFDMIRKAVGKDVKLKNFGIKKDSATGQSYLAFSASFEDVTAEPIYIHIEGGVPKIDVSGNAKVALTKTDPGKAKLFRAELVTVQERVLDEMDDLAKAIHARDNYLAKLENEVDGYVAGLSPLQVSLLKQLLVKKYRKIS